MNNKLFYHLSPCPTYLNKNKNKNIITKKCWQIIMEKTKEMRTKEEDKLCGHIQYKKNMALFISTCFSSKQSQLLKLTQSPAVHVLFLSFFLFPL